MGNIGSTPSLRLLSIDHRRSISSCRWGFSSRGPTDLQALVFRHAWTGQGYTEIAENSGYEVAYIKEVGSKLWQHLLKAFGEKVTKTNIQSVFRRQAPHQVQRLVETPSTTTVAEAVTKNQYQDWGEAIDGSLFYGRTQELVILEQWVVQERCRLITILGMGGIGKTALAVKLALAIAPKCPTCSRNSNQSAQILVQRIGNSCRLEIAPTPYATRRMQRVFSS